MASETIERVKESFELNRERFEAFCRSLSDEELGRLVPNSTWVVKDFVSHLATLDTELVRWFEAVGEGRTDAPARGRDGQPFDVDRWNDAAVAERRGWSLDRIFEEASANRTRLLAALEELDDEKIEQTVRFPGDNKRPPADVPFKLFLFGLARHDKIHVADMLKALPERAEHPELKAWLDDPTVKWYQNAMSGPARG